MRTRAFRRHQTYRHMIRRLKEDRNQHYEDLACPCWYDPRAMSRFKEQPKLCSCWMCSNNASIMAQHGRKLSLRIGVDMTKVEIEEKTLERLQERSDWLECLEAAGVDNWQGIEEAIRIKKKWDEEQKDCDLPDKL